MSLANAGLAVAAVAGAVMLCVAAYVDRPQPTPDPVWVEPPPASPRTTYLPGSLPQLAMPDGKRAAVRSMLNVERPLHYGDFVWNETGVPAGRTWVRVDLKHQTLSVFRDGHEIGTAVILYGTDGKPTPSGDFTILQRAEHHRSSLYDAEMPYMLRLTGDGVAIHASAVRRGTATHGCIGVPEEFARQLFAAMRRGDHVAIMPA